MLLTALNHKQSAACFGETPQCIAAPAGVCKDAAKRGLVGQGLSYTKQRKQPGVGMAWTQERQHNVPGSEVGLGIANGCGVHRLRRFNACWCMRRGCKLGSKGRKDIAKSIS